MLNDFRHTGDSTSVIRFATHRRDSPRVTEIILGKQPAAQHKETRKAEEDKYCIIAHSGISQTEMTDMCKDDEDHCKPSHRIDVCYPLFRHSMAKVQFFFQYLG